MRIDVFCVASDPEADKIMQFATQRVSLILQKLDLRQKQNASEEEIAQLNRDSRECMEMFNALHDVHMKWKDK